MAGNPPAYHSVYDNIPFDQHPEECPCIYHQVDGDALIRQANDADSGEWGESHRGQEIAACPPESRPLDEPCHLHPNN
jgi:hypothetical protein